jgi:serpin B
MTSPGQFHLLDGGLVQVPMMRQTDGFRYADMSGLKAVELPYDGYELSMVLLVPDAGRFEEFEESLDAAVVDDAIGALVRTEVALTMPKFKLESSLSLNQALVALGMSDAFSPGVADFSGMDGQRDLFIADVIHKSFVDVDEAGTEAAAATAVVMEATAMPAEPVDLSVDRPFIFLIRDIETGTVLFVGRVMDPS